MAKWSSFFKFNNVFKSVVPSLQTLHVYPSRCVQNICVRHGSYHGSRHIIPTYDHTGFEVSKSPEEWKWVEKVLPLDTVPPLKPKDEYPSGFIPPKEEAKKLPYFIRRSKNHMLSVYYKEGMRGLMKRTYIRHIQGDIWALEKDLKKYLEENSPTRKICMYVNEFSGIIVLRGEHVRLARHFLLKQGF